MEWLMIIAFIAISIMDSKKKSDQAKQQRSQRQRTNSQQMYPSGDNRKSQAQPKKDGSFMGSLTDFLETLEDALDGENPAADKQQPVPSAKRPAAKQAAQRQGSVEGKSLMQTASKKKKEQQAVKKSASQLPTKTLMEQRPDREKREEHTKVTASVRPLTANVKPLKNAFENDEHCEHRIQLNPNIQYSKQQQQTAVQRAAMVKTDGESIVQGIIWSEILGKPKAYQNQARRIGR